MITKKHFVVPCCVFAALTLLVACGKTESQNVSVQPKAELNSVQPSISPSSSPAVSAPSQAIVAEEGTATSFCGKTTGTILYTFGTDADVSTDLESGLDGDAVPICTLSYQDGRTPYCFIYEPADSAAYLAPKGNETIVGVSTDGSGALLAKGIPDNITRNELKSLFGQSSLQEKHWAKQSSGKALPRGKHRGRGLT